MSEEMMIPTVNRACLIVTPLRPFLDWINSFIENEAERLSMATLREDGSVYLMPEVEIEGEVDDSIDAYHEAIFKAELDAWQQDQTRWPKINFETFYAWFDVDCRSVVMDLDPKPLGHDEYE